MKFIIFAFLAIISVCLADENQIIIYQLENLSSSVYQTISQPLNTLIMNYPLTLIQGIQDQQTINSIAAALGSAFGYIQSTYRVEYQAIFYNKTVFSVTSALDNNFISIAPLIVKVTELPSTYSFYLAGLRTNSPVIDFPYFTDVYNTLNSTIMFAGDWKLCSNFTSSFTTNPNLIWEIQDNQNTLINGTCASDRVVISSDLQYIYPLVSVFTGYKTVANTSQDLSNHYPILVDMTFPPKPNTPFWIELAIIGGGILFFLVFVGSLMLCLCLTCNLVDSFKSYSKIPETKKLQEHI